mmetsp:Transcript_19356/g.39761  ORF Transcript_19356/g.39761 Transcript_19356/m.39761 type:complete len:230 (+) Transcript_19356:554-1243(+)
MQDHHRIRRHPGRRLPRHRRRGHGGDHAGQRRRPRGPRKRPGRGHRQQGAHRRQAGGHRVPRRKRQRGQGRRRHHRIPVRGRRLRRNPHHPVPPERLCRGRRRDAQRNHQRVHQFHAHRHGRQRKILRRGPLGGLRPRIRRGRSHARRGWVRRPIEAQDPHAAGLRNRRRGRRHQLPGNHGADKARLPVRQDDGRIHQAGRCGQGRLGGKGRGLCLSRLHHPVRFLVCR